ncbi:Ulp1 protease family, C-terminal catalytic domain [Phytophthora cactorum]|nr:Ulp1 protease family, C-terminal catalytic domain [Phytophthora cactorum]
MMAMQFIWSLAKICTDDMSSYSWLMGSVDAKFKDEGAAEIADKALGSWPCARLEGFGSDFTLEWAHVYCVRADSWFNDNLVATFVKTLANKYSSNTTIFLPALKTPASARGKRIPPPTLSLVVGATEQFVFMPLNINSSHWTCLVLDSATKTIYCYDNMDKRSHHNLSLHHPYQITSVHNPLQNDGHNCGLFICLFFWRRLAKEVGSDYTESGLMRRRWDILRMALPATKTSTTTD